MSCSGEGFAVRTNLATKPSLFSFGVMSERGVPELVQRRDVGGIREQRLGLPAAKPDGRRAAGGGTGPSDRRHAGPGLRPFNMEIVLALRPGGSLPAGIRRNLRR